MVGRAGAEKSAPSPLAGSANPVRLTTLRFAPDFSADLQTVEVGNGAELESRCYLSKGAMGQITYMVQTQLLSVRRAAIILLE